MKNLDSAVVAGFGDEWTRFDQTELNAQERDSIARAYFAIFPWERLDSRSEGFDLGCGSGRWAAFVSPRVGSLHCIDASADALAVARSLLAGATNVRFHHASVDDIPLEDGSQDFGYSLGVLHHVPDTQRGLRQCVQKLKIGAPLLVYLYYRFDNRPTWFRLLHQLTELFRSIISRSPGNVRYGMSQIIAAVVYWPLARSAGVLRRLGAPFENFPLAAYSDRSFYVMRTDALDRFGTRLSRRYTRVEIQEMLQRVGLSEVRFSEAPPFWCAVGIRAF